MKGIAGCLCNSVQRKQWFTPRQKQQFPFCRLTKTNACHCYVSNQTRAAPRQWWYIVALEQDILLCCWKQKNRSFSSATVRRLKFKSNATFKQMSVQEIKTVLSMPGIKQNTQLDIWKWFSPPLSSFPIKLTWQSSEKNAYKNPHDTNRLSCSRSTSKTCSETFYTSSPNPIQSTPEHTHKHDSVLFDIWC